MSDLHIWGRIVAGDVAALRVLHDKYYHLLWLWISKYTQDQTLADELVSDCFIKLWENRRQIHIEKSLKSYLYRMLYNQLISQLRKAKREIVTSAEQLPDIPDEAVLNSQDYYVELYRTIQKIPGQRRKILELAVFDSLSYKEIAARLDISVNTVKTQMGRAYQFLKEELDPNSFLLLSILRKQVKTAL